MSVNPEAISDFENGGISSVHHHHASQTEGGWRHGKGLQEELDQPVSQEDFKTAVSKTSKSVGAADLRKYTDWMKEFGSS